MQQSVSMNTYNRRRSPRVPMALPVRLMCDGIEHETMIVNINEHGLFVRTHLDLDVGERVQLSIELPDGIIQAIVVVRSPGPSSDGRGAGVELHEMTDLDRARWRRNYRLRLKGLRVDRSGEEEAYL